MLVPSKTANGPPKAGIVADRIAPPGAPRSGFSSVAEGGRAARGEARHDAAAARLVLQRAARPIRARRPAAARRPGRRAARRRRGRRSSPDGIGSRIGIAFASLERLSTITSPTAPASCARSAFGDDRAAAARDERDRAGERAARQRVRRRVRVAPAAQSWRSTGLPSRADDRADVDERAGRSCPHAAGGRTPAAGTKLNWRPPRVSAGPKTCVFDRRRDGDRVGRDAREPGRAQPELLAVVPGRDHGHDPGGGHVRDGLDEGVVGGVGHRAAAGEVDHVHPVPHGGLEGGDDLRGLRRCCRSPSAR